MRRAGGVHDGRVEWGDWAERDRTVAQLAQLEVGKAKAKEAEFDTTIAGPWMNQWPLIHQNRHTANLKPSGLHGWGGGAHE